ncbi:MAG: ABC transporter permease [Anaerolineaceae bacterium]|nr:ABC transporter permease [Anaerolineaceae bacterium]
MVVLMTLAVAAIYWRATPDSPVLTESTPGQLALWMADQSTEDAPEAILGQLAKQWGGADNLTAETALNGMRTLMVAYVLLAAVVMAVGVLTLASRPQWGRVALLFALFGLDSLLLLVPSLEGDVTLALVLASIFLLLVILLFAPGKVSRVLGFMVVLSALLMAWEGVKAITDFIDYKITLPQSGWTYTAYDTLDDSLAALAAGDVSAVIVDAKTVRDDVPPYPEDSETDAAGLLYPDLRLLTDINTDTRLLGLPVEPDFPGRLGVVVRAADAARWDSAVALLGQPIGTVTGDFAEERFLSAPRDLVLLNLKITNDLNLPHLQDIAEAMTQPARRNGPVLLVRILFEAGLYTWSEAAVGFLSGALLGFLLGTLFAHSGLMERGLLPYVVASQTVPILAIAPMVVIWLGANAASVAVISAYLTFFPVTINTLRGLQSPSPNALELMHSYAATRWAIMWKLRFPAALPYIFTALKVSATASVVGAIIGELPSGIRSGLGRAILDFSSDYSLISTPKLWSAIVMAALVGIASFVIVALVERAVLRGNTLDS